MSNYHLDLKMILDRLNALERDAESWRRALSDLNPPNAIILKDARIMALEIQLKDCRDDLNQRNKDLDAVRMENARLRLEREPLLHQIEKLEAEGAKKDRALACALHAFRFRQDEEAKRIRNDIRGALK